MLPKNQLKLKVKLFSVKFRFKNLKRHIMRETMSIDVLIVKILAGFLARKNL